MATKISTPIAYSTFATFGVISDLVEPYKYQWKRNGVPVGGSNKSYQTPPLKPDDFKAKYSVTVWGLNTTETSAEVMIGDNPVVVATPAKPAAPPPPPAPVKL